MPQWGIKSWFLVIWARIKTSRPPRHCYINSPKLNTSYIQFDMLTEVLGKNCWHHRIWQFIGYKQKYIFIHETIILLISYRFMDVINHKIESVMQSGPRCGHIYIYIYLIFFIQVGTKRSKITTAQSSSDICLTYMPRIEIDCSGTKFTERRILHAIWCLIWNLAKSCHNS